MSLQAKRERIAALAKETEQLLKDTDGKKWTTENQAVYDNNLAEIDTLKAEIDRHTKLLALDMENKVTDQISDAANRKAKNSKSPESAIFAKWLRGGDKALNKEDFAIIRNTMSTTTPGEGGYTVPSEVASSLVESLKAFGGVREVATVIKTETGAAFSYPTSDGTSETGELIAENTTATAADPTFGTVALTAYKFSSKVVAVPFELLQDSAVDIEAFVNSRLTTRLGRVMNTYLTTGTGSSQPKGVAAGATSGKVGTTGQTATVIYDDLVDLVHAVDPAYRKGKCGFMMHDASLKVIRKLKDSAGRPIFLPGYDGLGIAMPDTLLGYPITINQDIATMAANAKSILFGDFSKYVIRDVMGAQMFRFDDSAYIKLGQIGFLGWMRAGGNLTDTAAVKYYQNSAT